MFKIFSYVSVVNKINFIMYMHCQHSVAKNNNIYKKY